MSSISVSREVDNQPADTRPGGRIKEAAVHRAGALLLPTLGIAIAVGLWWLYSIHHQLTAPSPPTVVSNLASNFFNSTYLAQHGVANGRGYWYDLIYTVQNVLVGVAVGSLAGVSLGVASAVQKLIGDVLNPLAAAFGSAPIFVSAPFFLIWFGIVAQAQMLIVAFYTTLLMFIFAQRAVGNVPLEYVEYGSTLGVQRLKAFRKIYVPATVPELIAGFRIALAGAWGLEALAELLGAQQGLGFLIAFFVETESIARILAVMLLLGLTAVFFDALLLLALRYVTRWQHRVGEA